MASRTYRTEEEIQALSMSALDLRKDGLEYAEIAERLGVPASTAYRFVRAAVGRPVTRWIGGTTEAIELDRAEKERRIAIYQRQVEETDRITFLRSAS